ncbi:hypothetical protein [Streptomyces aureus]|uniref:hypothetical protein n=1 Tax=Streptomyces aureus TaxID=193461 RepID=UPI003159328B
MSEETARVWRLYLVGGALAFEERRMGGGPVPRRTPGATGDSGLTGAEAAGWYRRLEEQ